jgi:hypothetical protein
MKWISLIFISLILAGCATQSAYKAARGDSTGYKEIALAPNHYQVQFKMRGQSRTAVQKYVLTRAAELTIAQGYDWFVVEKRSMRRLNEEDPFKPSIRPGISRNCGLLRCRTRIDTPDQTLDLPDTETLAIVEIRMGRGIRPEQDQSENESYDARELWEASPDFL